MSMEPIQIGYMPPADKITADNVMNLVMYGQTKAFDFVVSPINSPNYSRVLFPGEGSQSPALVTWRAGKEAFKPEDLILRTAGNRTSSLKLARVYHFAFCCHGEKLTRSNYILYNNRPYRLHCGHTFRLAGL